ncbi:hypothetical protein KSP39_PZI011529 [Platanthera zijinensis]|uniref:Late embryogenesis abundant protein LEA-2 subgroup domain-containing protein n=1 Tax=Platanthera zijinensis TaxID=2320716 RepID=A0AAP0G5X4_9ASPA
MHDQREQVRPLAFPSPILHTPTNEGAGLDETGRKARKARNRCCALWCCGCCGASVVVIGVTILVLFLTEFKIKNPEITLNGIRVHQLFVPGIGTLDNPTVTVNSTLTADISVKNPNIASFRFQNSTTDFFYDGETVGVAYAPDGRVKAYSTERMNVTVDVLAEKVFVGTNATSAALSNGWVDMSSFTGIPGRVNVLGFYKQNFNLKLNCSFTLDIVDRTINNIDCHSDVQ